MTTLTIDKPINLTKTHFSNLEELYLIIQEKLSFENHLQKKAHRAMNINELELIDL
jgi:hypothetical protein